MFGSRFILALVFALVASTGQTAFAGKKKGADTPKQEVRAEGAFYPDEYVPPEAPPPEAQAYDPFLEPSVVEHETWGLIKHHVNSRMTE